MPGSSPFTVLEDTFRLLGAEPHPLAIDGRALGHGLPCRQIPIIELRALLTRPTACRELHDRAIQAVIGRMPQQRATWVVVLGGLLLPGLWRLAEQLAASTDQWLGVDVEAELLACLLTATRRPACDTHPFAMHLLHLAQASRAAHCQPCRVCHPAEHRG